MDEADTILVAEDPDTDGDPSALTLREAEPDEPGLRAGAIVGRYVVLEEVGRGGMGRVLRAYDPKLQREVALKEVRGRILGPEGAQRLVAEARAMAKLSHANVVSVYDVDTLDDGRLVLVMEYVAGTTLRAWLDASPREPKEIIARFIAAGRGLCAAHAAGILHRDFKPSNVLVGDDELVKVTDFGLAKLDPTHDSSANAEPLVDADLTRSGLVVGTPRYMAPEQHRGEKLSTAADQYAFCVALWEALVGDPPFTTAALVLRKLSGAPPWPTNVVVARHVSDAIRRGLAPRPEERWPSLDALLGVLARKPGRRRDRVLLGAGAITIAAVSIAIVQSPEPARCSGAAAALAGVWDETRRTAVHAAMLAVDAPNAPRVWERTAAALDAHAMEWTARYTEVCEATTIRGEQSPEAMDLRMACLHRAKVDLEAVTGVLAQADREVIAHAHELVQRLRPLHRCDDLDALRADVEPPLPEEAAAVETIRVLVAEASAEEEAGHYAVAKQQIDAAQSLLVGVEYGPVHTEVAFERASILGRLGEVAAAETAGLEALSLATTWRQWNLLRDAASLLMYEVGREQQRVEEGLRYRELVLGLAKGDTRAEMVAHSNLGMVLHAGGRYAEAEVETRRALEFAVATYGPEHHEVASCRTVLAMTMQAQSRFGEAESEIRDAIAMLERTMGSDFLDTADARHDLAVVLERQGRFAEAEQEYRHVLEVATTALGPEHPRVAKAMTGLATSLRRQRKIEEAEQLYRRALALFNEAVGPEYRETLIVRANLAVALADQGRHAEAVAEHRQTVALYEKVYGPEHPDTGAARLNLANALVGNKEREDAEREYRRALAILEVALGDDHLSVALGRSNLAKVLLVLGRPHEALTLAEQSWKRRQKPGVPATQRAQSAFGLAQALWEAGQQRERAKTLAREALATFEGAGAAYEKEARLVAAWLEDPAPVE